MKRTLNILHYSLYLIEIKLHHLFNKINPGLLIYKIPRVKKWMKDKNGIENTKEWLDNFWLDKKDGYSLLNIVGWLTGIIFLLLISSTIFLGKLFYLKIIFNNYTWICIPLLGISWAICYFHVFKNDKYLIYFEEFEKWTILDKRKNVLLSIGFILFVIVFFFVSLLYFP
ncbi:hypothetical protein [Psychroserpens luteus]|uniref:Uncharacterized protein n=1 Tax=Psychroserpens luteus TaxID=1434066 RepID=A0ABW5ZYF1_9FLAO|nr:hypothetical protein [Psychroserpens luteus]